MRRRPREFTVVIERDPEGWYVGSCPQLKGCHTQGRTLDELMRRMREAIAVCLEAEKGRTDRDLELVGIQKISL